MAAATVLSLSPALHGIHLPVGRCACAACSRPWDPTAEPGATAATAAGATAATTTTTSPTGANAPAASLQTLADYLRVGFWQASGTIPRQYNLTNTGPNANDGELLFNISGWSFDTDGDGIADGDPNGLTTARRDLVREVFKLYQASTGIRFVETTASDGSVDLLFTDNDTGTAYAYAAGASFSNGVDYSVINVGSGWNGGRSNFDSYTVQTILHEIGHALGLGHQGLYNGSASYANDAQFANDTWQVSMMSYFGQSAYSSTGASYAFLQSPMAADWLALDAMVGPSGYGTATAFLGDTIYGVGTTISAAVSRLWNEFSVYVDTTAYTIVDGGGYDTLDVSNFSVDQRIDLAPSDPGSSRPSLSNIGGKIGNLSIAVGTLLEAATGGAGNDSFFGNDTANTFRGGDGNDWFVDSLGSDIYYGDAGIDTLTFQESLDLFTVESAGDSLLFSRPFGNADVDQVWNGLEDLSFAGVATTYQLVLERFIGPPLPSLTIDTVNGSLASGAITNATLVQLSGTLSQALTAGQSINVYRDGLLVGSATATATTTPEATSWTFTLQEIAGTRTVAYTAQVVEANRNRSGNLSRPFQLTVDTEAPLVSVTPLDTQNPTPLLRGHVSEAAVVTVAIGDVQRTANTDASGGWSLAWSDPLAPGQIYELVVEARDVAGNLGRDGSSGELQIVPDDLPGDAGTGALLSVGSSLAGQLELAGDRDWVAVDLQAGRTYAFSLTGTTLADPLLRLRDARGLELASHNDLSALDHNALIRFTPTTSGRFFLEAGAFLDAGSGTYSLSAADVTPPPILFFSLQTPVTTAKASVMGGLTASANDIVAFDGSRFHPWLNGNNSGLAGAVLRDFHIVSDDEVVVALQNPVTLAGIAFDDSDLARLSRGANGWSVSLLFDGSDVGLTTNSEAIDAITGLADGSLLLSTRGGGSVSIGGSTFVFAAEDLMRFNPSSLGDTTAGSWSVWADLSDMGITGSTENISAVDVVADGRVFLVSSGATSAPASAATGGTSLTAANEDVFVLQPASLGATTSGSFPPGLFFDGSLYGLANNALWGLDVPA
jgi:hypothetical protein